MEIILLNFQNIYFTVTTVLSANLFPFTSWTSIVDLALNSTFLSSKSDLETVNVTVNSCFADADTTASTEAVTPAASVPLRNTPKSEEVSFHIFHTFSLNRQYFPH